MGQSLSRSLLVQCATSEWFCGHSRDLRNEYDSVESDRTYFDEPPDVVVVEVRNPTGCDKTTGLI